MPWSIPNIKHTGWCYQSSNGSIVGWVCFAFGLSQASAWCGMTFGTVESIELASICYVVLFSPLGQVVLLVLLVFEIVNSIFNFAPINPSTISNSFQFPRPSDWMYASFEKGSTYRHLEKSASILSLSCWIKSSMIEVQWIHTPKNSDEGFISRLPFHWDLRLSGSSLGQMHVSGLEK